MYLNDYQFSYFYQLSFRFSGYQLAKISHGYIDFGFELNAQYKINGII